MTSELRQAIEETERDHPLPRCAHGAALRDGAGEALEPPCGCRGAMDDEVTEYEIGVTEREVAAATLVRDACSKFGPTRLPDGEDPTSFSLTFKDGSIYEVRLSELRKPRHR